MKFNSYGELMRACQWVQGQSRDIRGQRYECVSVKPYNRRDGEKSAIATLKSKCADCPRVFKITVPALADVSKLMLNRRCARHVSPGKKVKPRPEPKAKSASRSWRLRKEPNPSSELYVMLKMLS